MTFLKIIIWLVLIPYVLGKLLEDKERNNTLYSWVLGYVVEMGVFLFLAIPMIVNKIKFDVLLKYYNIAIYVLIALSLILNWKRLIPKKKKKTKITFMQFAAVLVILIQVLIKYTYSNVNNDDVSFVVLGAEMIETGYMYYDESPENELIVRRALAPISAFFAVLSQNLGIHVTIVMHTVEPMVFIIIGGIVFYNFGKVLFKNDKDAPYIFVILMILSYSFFFTTKGVGLYYLLYTWFGRALIGAVFLPILWKTVLEIFDGNETFKNWLTIFLTVSACCVCSEMAIALVSISMATMSLIYLIRNRKIWFGLKSLVCVLPCIALGILYITMQ